MKLTGRPKTVSEYINSSSKESRSKLREMRKCIKAVVPNSQESLKWGMPAFSNKRILVIYGAFKNHIGFYPTPGPIKAFAKELANYKTAKGSIQFPFDKPLPLSLIRNITRYRVKELQAKDKKWKER